MVFAAKVGEANLATGNTSGEVPTLLPEDIERLGRPGEFVNVAEKVLGLSQDERNYLDAIPDSLLEGIRGAVVAGLGEGLRVQWTFAPAYDFEVRLWSYADALVVYIGGPYTGQAFARDVFRGAG